MKLKYNFVVNKVADSFVAVTVGKDSLEFNGFVKMDEVAVKMFELLKEDITAEQMVAKMKEAYPETEISEIEEAVEKFTEKLKAEGVI